MESVSSNSASSAIVTGSPIRASGSIAALAKALRPYQWGKNLLLLVPLMMAHRVSDWPTVWQGICAIASFCFASSAVYVLNDLVDLEADRAHPHKSYRPFATGALSPRVGFILIPILAACALGLALLLLPIKFAAMVALYLTLAALYSLYLKQKLLVDVFLLAGFYTLRILAGGVATGIVVSTWLLVFSMFFFLSLAFIKRYSEFKIMRSRDSALDKVRGYRVGDIEMFKTVGVTSGYVAVLVLCLYISSEDVRKLYPRPQLLWLVAPMLLYWITRLWFLAERHMLDDDPIIFAFKDHVSYIVGVLAAALVVAASLHL